MDEPFDAGAGARHGELLEQPAELHDEGDLARSEVLADEDARDEGERDEHVGRDVELGHKADDGL